MVMTGCYTIWGTGRDMKTMYASHKPGDGGVDWGYSPKRSEAMPLTWYWVRRFESDMGKLRRVGSTFCIGYC